MGKLHYEKKWTLIKRFESIIALLAVLAFIITALEYAAGTSSYPYAKRILNSISKVSEHTLYVKKITTLRNVKTGQIKENIQEASGGLYIQMKTFPIGYTEGDWVVDNVETIDLSVWIYTVLSLVLVISIAIYGRGVIAFYKLPIAMIKRSTKNQKVIMIILSFILVVFLIKSTSSMMKTLAITAEWMYDALTPSGYRWTLAILSVLAVVSNYLLRFERKQT